MFNLNKISPYRYKKKNKYKILYTVYKSVNNFTKHCFEYCNPIAPSYIFFNV